MRALALALTCLAVGCPEPTQPENPRGSDSNGADAPGAAQPLQAQQAPAQQAGPAPPPAVLSGEGFLYCTISSRENGRQSLKLQSGQGLEFDVAVSPIVDGIVQTRGPEAGGSYRFSSHLAREGKGTLSGAGEVVIEALETKVNVAMNRYQQPNGPGTELTFRTEDMARLGLYVEFAGRARAANGDRYAFRVTLAQPKEGSGGQVTPASDANNAGIAAKVVTLAAPVTTVVSSTVTTTVQKLP